MRRFVASFGLFGLTLGLESAAFAQTAFPPGDEFAPDAGAVPAEPSPSGATPTEPAPAPTAPPPESPPVEPNASTAPTAQPSIVPEATGPGDTGAAESVKTLPPPERTLGLELDGGISTRLGDASDYGFDQRQSGGLAFGPSIWFAPSRLWSIGLVYYHSSLGMDRSTEGESSLDVRRSLDTIWFSGRAYPWRTDTMGIFIALSMGASWQHASADGTRTTQSFVRPAEVYACSGSEGPGFAIGGGAGFDFDVSRDVAFITQASATGHRHTSDPIGGCAPGSGSVTAVSAFIGFAYRFDLEGGSGSGSESRSREALSSRGNSALLR